jgi:FkbM family methyltransferase
MLKPIRKIIRWHLKRNGQVMVPSAEYDELKKLDPDEYRHMQEAWPEYYRLKDQIVREGNVTMRWAGMERLRLRHIDVGTIIDVGAANGETFHELKGYFPDAKFLCVEAEPSHEPALAELKRTNPALDYVIAAAGPKRGKIFFGGSDHDVFGGRASLADFPDARHTPMTTVDLEIKERNLPPPFFLKLDTHGFEVPILEGAEKTLAATNILLIEAYNIRLDPNCLLFYELCQLLDHKGFACADILEPKYRQRDHMLWHMDIVFLRKNRPEFSDPEWGQSP